MVPRRRIWLLPLFLVACEDRVGQCNDLIGRLNPHTEAMVAGVEGLAKIESDPGRLDTLVSAIDAADRELAVVPLDDQRLAGFALQYRKQLMDARAAGEAMRAAVSQQDAAGLHAAAKQADAFLDAQATIVEQLNAYCAGG